MRFPWEARKGGPAARMAGLVVALSLILAACGGGAKPAGTAGTSSKSSPATGSSASKAPIVIGFLDTLSGPLAQVGQDTLDGARIAVDQINSQGGVNGRKLELSVKDEQVSQTVTVQAMRDFASAGVHIVTGFTSSADCLAAAPIAEQNGMVIVSSACSDKTLHTTNFHRNLFSVASDTDQMALAAAQYVSEHYANVKTWDNASYDYQTGHDFWTDFQTELKKLEPGVAFGKSVFFPLTATQVSSYVSALLSATGEAGPRGLFMGTFGSGTIQLAQQGQQYDLFSKYAVALNVSGSEPTSAALGPKGPRLTYVQDYYYQAYHNEMNDYLVSTYMKTHNHGPDEWTEQGYTSIQVIAQALKKAGKDDAEAMIQALTAMHLNTPKGDAYFRPEDHLFVSPETVWECQGDATSPIGYSCPVYEAIPAEKVTPPVANH